jgi:nitroreductase
MDFFDVINARHSYRGNYAAAEVPWDDLAKILDAGLRAPSGCNGQTTRFIVSYNASIREEIATLLHSEGVRTAPVLIIAVTRKHTFDFGLDFELEDYSAKTC